MYKVNTVIGVIKSSSDVFVPLNTKCKIVLDKHNNPYTVHRLDTGEGTWLFSEFDRKNTIWEKN